MHVHKMYTHMNVLVHKALFPMSDCNCDYNRDMNVAITGAKIRHRTHLKLGVCNVAITVTVFTFASTIATASGTEWLK